MTDIPTYTQQVAARNGQPDPLSVDEVAERFQRWLYLPDVRPLYAVIGSVAANLLPGDPVWLLLVGPPGAGKSELLQSLIGMPNVHPAATLTAPALLSGSKRSETARDARGGLLRQIGEFGIILCKDFGSVLSMNRDARAEVLAALREVYDGSWTRHVGTEGGRTLHWHGKIGLLAGAPPTIDRHHAVMGAMGERFVLFRMPRLSDEEHAQRALAHAGHEHVMRFELADAVHRLFARGLPAEPRGLDAQERGQLVSLATLAVRCRSAVERDAYHTREIELVPDPEAPTRLTIALERLIAGLDAMGLSRRDAWQVVTKTALDSLPAIRLAVIGVLRDTAEALTTPAVAVSIAYPTSTTKRVLEDLAAHGIAQRAARGDEGGDARADTWSLSDWARRLIQTATDPTFSPNPTRNV